MADDKPSSTAETELPPATREAIRAYMVKLILPSAVVGAVLGYVVSGLARLDATEEATKHATAAAERTFEAATEAKYSNARATEAAKSADDAQKILEKAKTEINALSGQEYDAFTTSLFQTREKLGRLGDQQFVDLNAKIDALSANLRGSILAAGVVKGGNLVVKTDGVSFDSGSGKVSFPNAKNIPFVTIVSAFSPNGQYLTGSCYTRSTGPDYFILWAGALDTGGRNNPPSDCTFTVVGSKQ